VKCRGFSLIRFNTLFIYLFIYLTAISAAESMWRQNYGKVNMNML